MPENIIHKYRGLIEEGLQALPFQKKPDSLYKPCRYILENGGKRIRPVLTLITCGLCRGELAQAVDAAIAIELTHNFTLVHDDIMDQAESRRGKTSIHVKWDDSTAILAGDELFVQACRQLTRYSADSSYTPEQIHLLYSTFFESVHTVCEGQAFDMEYGKRATVITTKEYLEMIRGKTVALLRGSMIMGGIVADAEEEELHRLGEIADSVGLAFQIQDDVLDLIADPDKFGKQRGGDIREGKMTYPMLLGLERGNETDRNQLLEVMKSSDVTDSDIDQTIDLLNRYSVIKSVREVIDSYYQTAFRVINRFGDSVYKEDLINLIHFLKNRDY
ncbi:MAG: polyprenyl synthetase family protein [Balneolaceae bacterium]